MRNSKYTALASEVSDTDVLRSSRGARESVPRTLAGGEMLSCSYVVPMEQIWPLA
jgi:hypothetical protein